MRAPDHPRVTTGDFGNDSTDEQHSDPESGRLCASRGDLGRFGNDG
jgi:hypothetical protein